MVYPLVYPVSESASAQESGPEAIFSTQNISQRDKNSAELHPVYNGSQRNPEQGK
jgi:hypothetical protein